MDKHSDLTFITNEKEETLLNRFKVLIKDTELFDVLVGYFYTSGFHSLYPSLEKTKKIRILIGISTNKQVLDWMKLAHQQELQFSSAETKEKLAKMIVDEMGVAEDSNEVEQGVTKFIAWLKSGKLEIKAYPTENIHAKLYIMSFNPDDRDAGRVITGSSNFTQSGLVNNLEFNVELKARGDYEFAKEKFETLWRDAIDVKDKYIQTIQEKTWLNDSITPYQLYLKFLYEYFKDELLPADEIVFKYIPAEFKQYEYQTQAVLNAKKILEAYGGVFISDVVGLGKTYVSAMLANQLDGRHLVLAPPILLDVKNPGSWRSVFSDFRVAADYQSLGKLDDIIHKGTEGYKNIFIDEAHRFRTESTQTYAKLAQICRGKRVVLVTATPLNNTPQDILSQIKLFQNSKKSIIPNMPNLEEFFARLQKKMKRLDRKKDRVEYIKTAKDNAHAIREYVLKYLMVRRTRKEIENYFSNDMKSQNLKFPEVENPQPIYYQLNEQENEVFRKTVELIVKQLKYARYKVMLYYLGEDELDQLEKQSQENMERFMRVLLIKRLESSFYAFRKTIGRFISHNEMFLKEMQRGNVYISKGYANKIFELLEKDDDAIQRLLDLDRAKKYPTEDFNDKLQKDLDEDLKILKEIKNLWSGITRDPKLLAFVDMLSNHPVLNNKKNKLITFTESRETAEYIAAELEKTFPQEVLMFSGTSKAAIREKVIENFDARARHPKDNYRILITTEVLSEGVNLHRSNVVINYDIPWNPTRLMQRVGRINRVDTKFDKIYSFNFFPTEQSNDQIKLKEAAEAKIQSFITLLGADAKLLTEGEDIESHELFDRLISKKTITGEDDEDESELKYLQVIRNIRDKDPDLFATIKRLPKKSRTARKHDEKENKLLTYFRKEKLQKFFMAGENDSEEIDFMSAAAQLEVDAKTPKEKLPVDFYEKLEHNKHAFIDTTTEEESKPQVPRGGASGSERLLKYLRAIKDLRQYTDDQEAYLKQVMRQIEDGALPKQTAKNVWKVLEAERKAAKQPSPLKVLACLQSNIPSELLQSHFVENVGDTFKQREVILSEYLIAD